MALILNMFWVRAASPPTSTPFAYFTVSPQVGCAPLLVHFYNASDGNTWSWDFGDGSPTSTLCSPNHIYLTPGTYTAKLTVNGTVTWTQVITVKPRPTPTVSGSHIACQNVPGYTYSAPNNGDSYSWNVPGGTYVASGPGNNTITVTWLTAGTNVITVTETNAYGCSAKDTFNVIVAPLPDISQYMPCHKQQNPGSDGKGGTIRQDTGNIPPIIPPDCICGNSVVVYTMPDVGVTYHWYITGGVILAYNSDSSQITVKWGHGTFGKIKIVAINAFGCKDSAECQFKLCPTPIASFTANTACLNSPTSFDPSASIGNSSIMGYSWDFGDASTSTSPSPTHTYAAAGTYTVKLTVTNENGCTDDTTITVTVNPGTGAPIYCPGEVCAGAQATYSTPYFPPPTTYSWSVTGGTGTVVSPGNNFNVTWGAGPVGKIFLTVTGGPYTCSATTEVDIPILPTTPPIYGDQTVCPNMLYTYSAPLIPGSVYTWTINGDAFHTVNGNTVTVDWGNLPPTTGKVSLHIHNALLCCEGNNFIIVNKKPILTITGPTTACAGQTATYFLPAGVLGTWTPTNGTVPPGPPSNSITVTWGTAGQGIISVVPTIGGTYCNVPATLAVTINPNPIPAAINGPAIVCETSTQTYTALVGADVISATWLPPVGGAIVTQSFNPATHIATVTINWGGPGTSVLTLQQTNTFGCTTVNSTYTVTIVSHALPVISGPNPACVNGLYTYSIPGSFNMNYYQWSVIGGDIVGPTNTNFLTIRWGYAAVGTVTVSNLPCGGSTTKSITIMDTPNVYIDTFGLTCSGTSVGLKVVGPATVTGYLWSTGATTPTITVSSAGTYWVQATNAAGCASKVYYTLGSIPALPHPTCNVTIKMLTPSPSPYDWVISVPAVAGNTYLWSNGATTPTIYVHTSVPYVGPYSCTVTNMYGCSSTCSASVPNPCPVPPCSGPGGPGNGCISATCPDPSGYATLTAPAGSSWSWSPGGYSTQSVYVPAGTYTVIYTDPGGHIDTCTYTFAAPPTPSFSVPVPACNTVTFSNTTFPGATYYYWDFGDGAHSTDVNGTHDYTGTGTYTVTLHTSLDGFCWASSSQTVTISDIITAHFGAIVNCLPYVTFTNSSTHLGGSTVTWDWDFGDGSPHSTAFAPTHIYTVAGVYPVILTAYAGGCSSSYTLNVKPHILRALIGPCPGCAGQPSQMIDGTLHSHRIVSWAWNINGTLSSLEDPWYVFPTAGTYPVSLTVTDELGCTSSISISYTVISFTPGPMSPPAGSTVTACPNALPVLTAPIGAFNYVWSDGSTTPSITPAITGDYSVTVMDPTSSCVQTLGPVHVIIYPKPLSSITLLPNTNTICEGTNLTLQAPIGLGYSYYWYQGSTLVGFGDHIIVNSPSQSGVYTVAIHNSYGCKDSSAPVNINVIPAPTVSITGNNPICPHGSDVLSATGGPFTSYLWTSPSGITYTTPTITASQLGTYILTVTASTGCTATTTATVSPVPMPDWSVVPKGCYQICAGSRDTIFAPAGFTYTWYNGATVVSTTNMLIITGSGSYWAIGTNPAYGCRDTSDTLHVTVVSPPVAHITSSGGSILCTGQGSLTLTASPPSGYTYSWTKGVVVVGTTNTLTVTTPGTYVLTVKVSNCCYSKDSITITEGNCNCFHPDSIFTNVGDTNLYTDQVWKGKYYISGKVNVWNTATLDLSVIDMIFDSTGEIIFHDNSMIRANNSVFRPCTISRTWVGLTFLDDSRGMIHTSTFKNAQIAINVRNKDSFSVKIVDNTFSQCNVGVYINKSGFNYTEGITGNSFVIDATPLPFATNDYFGIELYNTVMHDLISQNNFRNATDVNEYKNYYGVFAMSSSATVSNNTFTDMHRSIDVSSARGFTIENNSMEITQTNTHNDYQIRISRNDVPLLVFGNKIVNSLANQVIAAGIYAEASSSLNISNNNVKGFAYGIQMKGIIQSQVIENLIENSRQVGIYNDESGTRMPSVDIACNDINMDLESGDEGGSAVPIGIDVLDGDPTISIRTNCVFNTSYAIYVSSSIVGAQIPVIRNNFLYSYLFAGVFDNSYNGDIGTGGTFGRAGRNTFVSNNLPTAKDIAVVGPVSLIEGGNFGATILSGPVSPVSPDGLYNSTASCGVQINYHGNQPDESLDDIAICDHFNTKLGGLLTAAGDGTYTLSTTFTDGLHTMQGNPNATHIIASAMYALSSQQDITTLYQTVAQMQIVEQDQLQWLEIQYDYLMGNYGGALTLVNSIKPKTDDEADQQILEQLKLHLMTTGRDVKALTTGEISAMTAMDNRRGLNASIARDMLQMNKDQHDYIFSKPQFPALQKLDPKQVTNLRDEYLEAYPNPVSDQLTVRYHIENVNEHSIRVMDALGQEVQNVPLTYNAAELKFDVSHMAPGVYLIYINDGNSHHLARFVKN
jgi:PKD repeat protein